MIRLAVAGALGRMGRSVLELAARDERFHVAAALTFVGDTMAGTTMRFGHVDVPITDHLETACDVLIDFSTPSGTLAWLEVCERKKIPIVTGVTGHDESQLAGIRKAARVIPIVAAANFSVGMNTLLSTLGPIVKKLGDTYDIEIVETHHRHKVDAPSGTAQAIVREITKATGGTGTENVVCGRQGKVGARPAGQIGVHAVRMGEVVGQHEVHFSGAGETLTLRHAAQSRDSFAAGALRASVWVINKPPGLYSMYDVLQLRQPD